MGGTSDHPPVVSTGPRELRLALGMRGGVSLAVWIGGACAEIDELRASADPRTTSPSQLWSGLLRWSGYTSVVVDVMAGASAGGLNGVIYAAAQAYGFDLGQLRGAWLDLGDLGSMIRTADDDGASLLRGDGYFLSELDRTLREMIGPDAAVRPASEARLDLTLTTTLVEPALRGRGEEYLDVGVETRFASTFRFRHRGPGWLTDFPDGGDAGGVASRLALAARATSSFPFAFEGARVWSRRPPSFADDVPAGEVGPDGTPRIRSGPDVDMNGVFGDARCDGRVFTAMDGGVLDNIPLGRAVTSIADAPADNPTRRVLLYVRPGGGSAMGREDDDAVAVDHDDELRKTVGVVTGIVRTRLRPETITQDLDLLRRHNDLVARSKRLRRISFESVADRDALHACATAAYTTYRMQRAEHDAQVVRGLLDDPIGVLGEDPFPDALSSSPGESVTDRRWRAPLTYWSQAERDAFDADLSGLVRSRLDPHGPETVVVAGTGAVTRIIRLLLDLARYAESCGDESAGEIKGQLYEALLLHTELVERIRRLGWVAWAARARSSDRTAADGVAAVDGLLVLGPDEQEVVLERLRRSGGDLDRLRQRLLRSLDELTDPSAPPAGGRGVLALVVDEVLVPSARRLAACTGNAGAAATATAAPSEAHPGWWIHRALQGGSGEVGVADLAALEVMSFGEALVGQPASSRIDFEQLSSDNPTPIAAAFEKLVEAGDGVRPAHIPPDRKLAGNELKNFSAFLRRTWRDNDWMWGRLDAVPTLVTLLVTPQALLAAAAPPQTEVGLMAALRELVVAVDVHHGDWSGHLEEHVWAPRAERIRAEARAALARTAGDTEEDPPVEALREAVTASRQWQIFALHVGAPDGRPTAVRAVDGPPGSAPGLRPDQAIDAARDYGVGIQTLTDPRDEGDQELVHRLASAGRRALRDNLSGDRVPAGVFPWIDRTARLLSWAWLDRSPSFWVPMAALVAVTLFAAVGAPVLLTEQTGAARWWAAGAVPGVLLLGGAALARALGRAAVAVGLLVVGAVLVVGACVSDANSLGVVALVAGALSLVLLALVALVRVRPTGARSRRGGPPGG